MMNKDQELLAEAYRAVQGRKQIDERDMKKVCAAKGGDCNCDKCPECCNNCKTAKATEGYKLNKDEANLKEAYEKILESKHINKKFARRYNKVTGALLKAEPGSKEYTALKSERDDLVNILKDHGKTPSDLEELLTKKEAEEAKQEGKDEVASEEDNQFPNKGFEDETI